MKILIIGSGGREHAIAWKLSQNKKIKHIHAKYVIKLLSIYFTPN